MLVVLQALDATGKDGAIKHVMSAFNPQGVTVHSFKAPSGEELEHDFLWRYDQRLPARGMIGIFNRSHYEEVLVVRVHKELLERQNLPESARGPGIWERRYRQINEEMLSHTSTRWAPWCVIHADRKWFAGIRVAAVIAQTLIELDPRYPTVSKARRTEMQQLKRELEAEAPKGADADRSTRGG